MWCLVFFLKLKTSCVVKETFLLKKNPAINDIVKVIYGNSKFYALRDFHANQVCITTTLTFLLFVFFLTFNSYFRAEHIKIFSEIESPKLLKSL